MAISPNIRGLFVTATDTEVGKTIVSSAIAHCLKQQGHQVGVSKPFASDCRKEQGNLVNQDAQKLAYFSDCQLPLSTINPIAYEAALAPAAAAKLEGEKFEVGLLEKSFKQIASVSDCLLVEGVGGLLVPLKADDPSYTVLSLIQEAGFPVLIVARSGLGTINHTAMTAKLLLQANCSVAGIVLNDYVQNSAEPTIDSAEASLLQASAATKAGNVKGVRDISVASNVHWIEQMTGIPVLLQLPQCDVGLPEDDGPLDPATLQIPWPIEQAVVSIDWWELFRLPSN